MRLRIGWTVAAGALLALAVSFFVRFGSGPFSTTYLIVPAGLLLAVAGTFGGDGRRLSNGLLVAGAGYLLVVAVALLDGADLDRFALANTLASAALLGAGALARAGRAWGAAFPAAAWLLLAVLLLGVGFASDAAAFLAAAVGAGVAATAGEA